MGYKIEKIKIKEYAKAGAVYYIPTGVAVGGTIFSIAMLNKTHEGHQKALAGAYAALWAMYDGYRRKIREKYGEDADGETFEEARNDIQHGLTYPSFSYENTYYEPYSNQFFKASPSRVIDAEHALNRLFALRGYVSLKDFLVILDLDQPEGSEGIGWSMDVGETVYGYSWIDFSHDLHVINDAYDSETIEYYEIRYPFEPTEDYLD